ncbi:MAG: hypothetical protein RLZZ628_1949, partial [Bacteroidota bacterium]
MQTETEISVHHLFMQSPVAILILRGKDYIVELANELYLQLVEKKKSFIGTSLFEALPELQNQGIKALLDGVVQTGIAYHGKEREVFLFRNQRREQCFFNFVYQPIRASDSTISGIIVVATEVTEQVLARQRVEANEKRFHKMLINSPFSFALLKGKEMNIIFANDSIKKCWGKGDYIEGKSLFEILPEIIPQGFPALLEQVFRTGIAYYGYETLVHLQRNAHWEDAYFNFVYQPYIEIDDSISGITIIAYEVTAQVMVGKAIAESEKKYQAKALQLAVALLNQKNQEIEGIQTKLLSKYSRTLIDASLDPLIIIDLAGKITDMNQALANITGMTRDALIDTNCFDFFTEPERARTIYETIFEKGFVANCPMIIKDHTMTDVLLNGSVYKGEQGEILGAVLVARDVTEQKRTQLELITAKNKAEGAMKSKQQFLSNMSHEIRTPMNAIIGFTKVLLKTELSAKQKEYLTAIQMSGDALIVLINDILDLAKVDAGKMTFEKTPFNLALSISTILHLFETKVQEKNLQLIKIYDPQIPAVIVGDPVRLHQIVLNLVSNAVKFTSKGSITVCVALVDENQEQVTIEFSVTDTGIGISGSQLETIFDNFYQASNETTRLFGGTGLGLAIVKQLLEPQGGKITVKSTVNEGSTFRFTLNFLKTDAEAAIKTETMILDNGVRNIKVLVAEDMALNQ